MVTLPVITAAGNTLRHSAVSEDGRACTGFVVQSRYRPGTLGRRRPAATGVITREFASESESQELTFGGQESSPLPTLRRPGGPGDGLTVTLIPAARC